MRGYIYSNICSLFLDEPPDEGFINGPIEPDQPIESVRPTPYSLPAGFQWDTLNVNDPAVLKELYTLLNENYVEDEDSMFRFDYQPDFLKWFVHNSCEKRSDVLHVFEPKFLPF